MKVIVEHKDALIAAGATAVLQGDPRFLLVDRANAPMTKWDDGLGGAPVLITDYESAMRYARAARSRKILVLTHLDSEVHVRSAIEHGIRGYLHLGCTADCLREAVSALHHGTTAFSPLVTTRIAESAAHEGLSQRELEVMSSLALGMSNKAISSRLGISVGTVKAHVKSIFRKLRVRARTEALAVAHRRGLLTGVAALPRPTRPPQSLSADSPPRETGGGPRSAVSAVQTSRMADPSASRETGRSVTTNGATNPHARLATFTI